MASQEKWRTYQDYQAARVWWRIRGFLTGALVVALMGIVIALVGRIR